MSPILDYIHVKCIHSCTPLWEMLPEVIHVPLFTYVEDVVRTYYTCCLSFWRSGSIFTTCWVKGLMLLSCIVHPSSFAWKFCRDHMVRPYQYTLRHTLPEEGYDAASYPRGMKVEVITASVAMCIHGWSVEPVMVVWIVWIFTLWFILELSNWLLVYLLQINNQEGSCELCGCLSTVCLHCPIVVWSFYLLRCVISLLHCLMQALDLCFWERRDVAARPLHL
jgi:hypothetical protein